MIGLHAQRRIAVFAFGLEAVRVDQQRGLIALGSAQAVARRPVDSPMGCLSVAFAKKRLLLKDLLQPAPKNGQHGAAFFIACRIAAIDRPGEGLDAEVRTGFGRPGDQFVGIPAESVIRHGRQPVAEMGEEPIGILIAQRLLQCRDIFVGFGRRNRRNRDDCNALVQATWPPEPQTCS